MCSDLVYCILFPQVRIPIFHHYDDRTRSTNCITNDNVPLGPSNAQSTSIRVNLIHFNLLRANHSQLVDIVEHYIVLSERAARVPVRAEE